MKLTYLAGIILVALLVGAAGAQTFNFEGTTSTGQYTGTMVLNDDGSRGLSIAGVSGGTLSAPVYSVPAEDPVGEPMVSQEWTIDATDGEGFAGCSVVGASGDQAWTSTDVVGKVATVGQVAGSIDISPWVLTLNGVYAGQQISTGAVGAFAFPDPSGFINSVSMGTSAKGDTATIQARSTGSMYLTQGAAAGSASVDVDPVYVGVNGAVAGQSGVSEGALNALNTVNGNQNVFVSGSAVDAQGNTADTSTRVQGGVLFFDQVVGAGTIDVAVDLFGIEPEEDTSGEGASGAFAVQAVEGFSDSRVVSTTNAESAGENSAGVKARADGSFDYIQAALAGAGSADLGSADVGLDCALAGQGGDFGSGFVEHGIASGFAADSQGNRVITTATVGDGSLDFIQVVGAGDFDVNIDADVFESSGDNPQVTGSGAFALQMVEGNSYDEGIAAFTGGRTEDGDTAFVLAASSGIAEGSIAQFSTAGDVNVDTGCEESDDILVCGAIAGQIGNFESYGSSTDAMALGFGADSDEDKALVFSKAGNGTLEFAQLVMGGQVGAGEIGNVNAALALQASNITGTEGRTLAGTKNAAGDVSLVTESFNNNNKHKTGYIASASAAGAGSVESPFLIPVIGDDTISGTGAGLYEFGNGGTLNNYNMTAYANLEGTGQISDSPPGHVNLHDAYAYTGLGDFDAKIGNHL